MNGRERKEGSRVDWSFGRYQKKKQKEGLVAIHETPRGITAVYGISVAEKMVVKAHVFQATESLEAKQEVLEKFVKENALQSAACTYVLASGDYTLHLVDEPAVPAEEIPKAMCWIVRDLIQFPIAEAVIDTFPLPFPRAKDNVKMLYAVVVKKEIISKIKARIDATGMALKYVDIPELALKNLLAKHPQQPKGCALMVLEGQGGKLILMKNESLCIARSFELKLDTLGKEELQDGKILESLALEVQRSFDYINSVFRQSVENVVILAPTRMDKNSIQASLKNSLGSEVIFLNVSEIVQFEQPLKEGEECEYLLAAGSVLREGDKPL